MNIEELSSRVQQAGQEFGFGAEQARVILAEALADDGNWLDPRYLHCDPTLNFIVHPVYRDQRVSLAITAFRPGAPSPAHNHNTWGVVGVYQGREREIRYCRTDTGLEVDRVLVNPRGSISMVPDDAIHSVEALDDCEAVSIHIYGADIVTVERSMFDLVTGAESPFRPDVVPAVAEDRAIVDL
ncbi:cysteine dioxygenase [Nocardia sp. NPDC101769]|uniref:cysteine dioxygenase family protein n=1 Tax=Nocardia sp. NPDC101769 TaxID=3364333 RepID=UPI003813A51B